jgi:hypothetical protein
MAQAGCPDMPKALLNIHTAPPLLDIVSFGRGGPNGTLRLSAAQIGQIERTALRVPEAMVKVLPKDSNKLRSVARHLNYIGRYGKLDLETDDGERMQGKDAGQRLLEDWDLDLDKDRRVMELSSVSGRAPKLVHKIMLSMPPGTPAPGVLEAARNFAREQFALKHRYALVLHTDEPHPHVHVVVKAVSEQGARLNVRKATLREWRSEFARHLRGQGIAANATERAVRGESRKARKDGIYRASLRGDSTYIRTLVEDVASDLLSGRVRAEPGKRKLADTRLAVERGWRSVANLVAKNGNPGLADDAKRFLERMPVPRTEREVVAASLLDKVRDHKAREPRLTR